MRLPSGCSMQVSSALPFVGKATNGTKLSLCASQSAGTASHRPHSMLLQTTFKTGAPIKTTHAALLHLRLSGEIQLFAESVLTLLCVVGPLCASAFACSPPLQLLTSQRRRPCGLHHSHVGRNDSALEHKAACAGLHFTSALTETTAPRCEVSPVLLHTETGRLGLDVAVPQGDFPACFWVHFLL